MNWILALVGAFVGAALSGDRGMFGALVGAALAFIFSVVFGLRRRTNDLEHELGALRLQVAAAASIKPAAAPVSKPADEVAADAQAEARIRQARVDAELPELEQLRASRLAQPDEATKEANATATEQEPAAAVFSSGFEPSAASGSASPPPIPSRPISAQAPQQTRREQPAEPQEPGWDERLLQSVKRWFTEGNVPVKIGVLVLFAGVAALLRYAAVQGYFTFPIEWRIATVAALAFVALGLGWRERERKPAFGLSLQGGAIGVLLLTVFAAFNNYHLLPPELAFALVVVLVAGAALLSVLQRNMPLAALGFLGGYLAPVLINTGSNNYIGLFSYYAVLNAAVFGISWARSWRLLNLIGFFFTFGVGSAWGFRSYRPEFFGTVEPFLILFFVFYVAIGLLYVIRQTEHRKPWVDGTLVFGTPMVAFPLQAVLLKDDRMALALSALVVALVYAGLVYYLRRRRGERLLTEAYGALALGFATLAIPLAFSAGTTATLWALEGAGVAWLGIRQNRWFPWLGGLALQLLAAGSYVVSMAGGSHDPMHLQPLMLNAAWLGAAILAFSGYALSLIHDRHKPVPGLSALLFLWATFWWLVATFTQVGRAGDSLGEWRFLMLVLVATLVLVTVLRSVLSWLRLNWLVALCSLAGLLMVFYANLEFDSPMAMTAMPLWLMYLAAMLATLWAGRLLVSRSLSLAHLIGLWSLTLLATMQLGDLSDIQQLAQGWQFVALLAPLALMTLGLWQRAELFAWPRAEPFGRYRGGWFALALPLLAVAVVSGLFLEGSARPLPYLPVFNPLELGLLTLAGLLFSYAEGREGLLGGLRRLLPYAGFVFVTMATLRTVHHWHGEMWGTGILDSGFSQASLTVVWSLMGVTAWIVGSRSVNRRLWMGGALLMGVVLLKLIAVDRQYMGNINGIVSFIAVGLLLVGVGYVAPTPPKTQEEVA